ncbi:hypothetical protein [Oceaniglobus ichthyenteri]|uniref:hypothetical protein n=1 Tax=Oceaniglobus ichthyenteri TaxID=2136177 RepID=UPI000F82FE84|nr:hypothetical protein [Oceaniglobus ichthyenteri]
MRRQAKPPKEMQIIGINIDDLRFEAAPGRHRARVQFRYDLTDTEETGTTDCLCHSDLPINAAPEQVRDALIDNAIGQLRRMPEMWLGEAQLTFRTAATPANFMPAKSNFPYGP